MTWRTHLLGGISALWLLRPLPDALTPENIGLLATLAGVGALLPDLDAAQSKVRSLEVGGVRPFVPLSAVVHRAFGHRGLLHSLPGWLGFGLGCLFLALWGHGEPLLALWIGYGSHLLLDACTVTGLPRGFRPLIRSESGDQRRRNARWHLLPSRLRFVTGSAAEDVLCALLAMAALLLLLTQLLAL